MTIKTYDRNILMNEALIASADRSIIQYVHIKDASRTIDIISFEELRELHTIAVTKLDGQLGKPKAEFAAIQWTRYAHGITAKMKSRHN